MERSRRVWQHSAATNVNKRESLTGGMGVAGGSRWERGRKAEGNRIHHDHRPGERGRAGRGAISSNLWAIWRDEAS